MKDHKKGQVGLGGLSGAFVGIGVALIILSFVALIISEVQGTMTADTAEYNVTVDALTTMGDMSDLVIPLGVVVVASVIIMILVGSFVQRRR